MVDTTKPVVVVPNNISVEATSAAGAAVTFTATATDVVTSPLTPSCTPASGSTFGLGTTTVNCSATDAAGNKGTASFTVTVIAPCDPKDLSDDLKDLDIKSCSVTLQRTNTLYGGKYTATISVGVYGQIRFDGTQYRLRVAADGTRTGTQVKWAAGSITGRPLLGVAVSGNTISFVIDLANVGVTPGGTLYWSADTQLGVKGKAGAGFLDEAPDGGGFKSVAIP